VNAVFNTDQLRQLMRSCDSDDYRHHRLLVDRRHRKRG
jgi:hypothetical protein